MKQKKILYIALLVLMPFLWACSNEEEHFRTNPPVEDGYSLLKMSFEFPMPKGTTYAAAAYAATQSEREIKSLAFITQTDDEGTPGQPDFKQGELNKFFSTEDIRSATGLHEPIVGSGNAYSTTIKIRSFGFGQHTKVAAIANYYENGLMQKLQDLESWEDLSSLITPEATNNLATPLLMFAEESVQLASGATVDQHFELQRIVARIDVINEAADPDPDKGLVLESALLVNPRKYSYLTPGDPADAGDFRSRIEAATEFGELAAGNPPLNDPLQVGCLYAYETANSSLHSIAATAVKVKGTYKGIKFDKVIPIKQPDKDGVTGDPIPLKRNYRYAINLKPGVDPTEVTWTVKVAEWDDGDEIEVRPPQAKVPLLSNFLFNGFAPTNTEWNETAKILDYTSYAGTAGIEMSFVASDEHYGTLYDIIPLYDVLGKTLDIGDVNGTVYQQLVSRDNPVITYSSISQKYNIKLPLKVGGTPDVPAGFMIRVMSSGNPEAKDSVIFRIIPDYDNTGIKPVLLAGRYWAPVNVGATTDLGTVNDVANAGYVYQFGRNEYPTNAYAPSVDVVQGPVDYADAMPGGQFENNFILGGHWLKDTDPNIMMIQNRWVPNLNDSPCPKGWRVPTAAELNLIAQKSHNFQPVVETYRIGIQGDENATIYLYFPKGPSLTHNAGVNAGRSLYWSSSASSVTGASYLEINRTTGIANTGGAVASWGFPIRCIQQDVNDMHP